MKHDFVSHYILIKTFRVIEMQFCMHGCCLQLHASLFTVETWKPRTIMTTSLQSKFVHLETHMASATDYFCKRDRLYLVRGSDWLESSPEESLGVLVEEPSVCSYSP